MTTHLNRLHLANWRNFKSVDLILQDRMFVVGPNASGKTNLLDAFRFLRDIATPGAGLLRAIEDRRGLKHLRSLHAGQQSDILVEVELEHDNVAWQYRLEIEGSESKNKPMQIKREVVVRDGDEVLARPLVEDRADHALLTQTHLEQKSQNAKFRPLVDALASIVHIHIVPQVTKSVIRTEELARKEAPGSDFIEQLARLSQAKRDRKLRRIEKLLKHAVPRFSELRVDRDDVGRPHLEAKYEHWRQSGGWQNEKEFSDGTLRLIGLLWAIDEGTAPLLIEEPELSLHADVTRQLPRLFSRAALRTGRQFIVSTHSEDMLLDRGIGPSEIIVLEPTDHETKAVLGTSVNVIVQAAVAKLPLARAVRGITRPASIDQLGFPGVA